MRVLVACEFSGTVRDAFTIKGHDAISCDLLPTEKPGKHYQGNVLDIINDGFDLMIAHPPCTYLSVSGIHWNNRGRGWDDTEKAIKFFNELLNSSIPMIAIENPIGIVSTRIRKPDQVIQPYMFGCDASKATCLWLKGLPILRKTKYVNPRIVNGRPRWSNQDDNGQNNITPSPDRWKIRSKTYDGIAQAMADQWSNPSFVQSSLF